VGPDKEGLVLKQQSLTSSLGLLRQGHTRTPISLRNVFLINISLLLPTFFLNQHCCLEARPKQGMSYTWRSILSGIELLKKGMIWRIGDGENINIWHDPWLPNRNSRKPITPRGHNLLRYVSELVRQTFWEEDVKVILSLTVHEGWPNIIAWHFDSKGQFSVRSAYKVFREDLLGKRVR
jgi:hypothetical protein